MASSQGTRGYEPRLTSSAKSHFNRSIKSTVRLHCRTHIFTDCIVLVTARTWLPSGCYCHQRDLFLFDGQLGTVDAVHVCSFSRILGTVRCPARHAYTFFYPSSEPQSFLIALQYMAAWVVVFAGLQWLVQVALNELQVEEEA